MLLSLLTLTAHAEDFTCGVAAGAVGGFIDVRDMWEFVNLGPFLLSASPMVAMACQPPVHSGQLQLGTEFAPWPVHFRMSEDRKIRQWFTATASWSAAWNRFSLGPALTGGSAGVGMGLRVGLILRESGAGLDIRMLNFLTDPEPNLQIAVLYSFKPMTK